MMFIVMIVVLYYCIVLENCTSSSFPCVGHSFLHDTQTRAIRQDSTIVQPHIDFSSCQRAVPSDFRFVRRERANATAVCLLCATPRFSVSLIDRIESIPRWRRDARLRAALHSVAHQKDLLPAGCIFTSTTSRVTRFREENISRPLPSRHTTGDIRGI